VECQWSGNLLPERAQDIWRGALPATPELVFHCPQCQVRWHVHVAHDDLDGLAEIEREPLLAAGN
jgi:hypothetical protein